MKAVQFLKRLVEDIEHLDDFDDDNLDYEDIDNLIDSQLDIEDNYAEEDDEVDDENVANSQDQPAEMFNAKAASDMILKDLMSKQPGKIKRISKSNRETKASAGFNFPLSTAEKDAFIEYYTDILSKEHNGKMSRDTQLEILDDASKNYKPAVIYLYCRYLRLIASVYERYYVKFLLQGNPTLKESDVRSEDSASEVRKKAFEILSNTITDRPSPHRTFKRDVYDDNADLIDHFGFWAIERGLQYPTIKIAKEFENGGLTGNRKEGDDTRVDSLESKMEDDRYNEPFEGSHEEQQDAVMLIQQIEDYLNSEPIKSKYPNFGILFDYIKQGYTPKEAAKKMNKSPENINGLWRRIVKLLNDEFGADLLRK